MTDSNKLKPETETLATFQRHVCDQSYIYWLQQPADKVVVDYFSAFEAALQAIWLLFEFQAY